MLMLNFSAAQHLCTALFERQRVGVPRIVHIQHGGAVAVDGDGFGLVRVVGEMLIVAAFKALVLIIAAALLRTGCNIDGRERSGYAVAVVIGILVPEYDSKSGSALSQFAVKLRGFSITGIVFGISPLQPVNV